VFDRRSPPALGYDASMPEPSAEKTLYLVDGTSQLFRAFYAIRDLSNAEGLPTNAVYGFTTMLRKLVREHGATHACVAFDSRGPVFRHELYADYKANRPPAPEELHVQVPYAKRVCDVLGVATIEKPGYEADDLIATCARRAIAEGFEVVVVASDKDLLQLVGEGVRVFNPSKEVWLDPSGVEDGFGVPPGRVRDVLALMGDSVDNVPGVPGVGEKTAKSIVRTYGDVESVVDRAERFLAVWEARDALVEAIDAGGRERELESSTAERIAACASTLDEAIVRLLDVERDDSLRPRLEEVSRRLVETDPRGIVAYAGGGGRGAVRPLAPLKRELKALDRGSGKRAWYAIVENVEQLRLSKRLVTLDHEVPVEVEPAGFRLAAPDPVETRRLFRSLGFTSLIEDPGAEGTDEASAAERDAGPGAAPVLTTDRLRELVAACREAGSCTVTVNKAAGTPLRADLIGIALAHGDASSSYVPLAHEGLDVPDQPSLEVVREEIGPLLRDPAVAKSAHDVKATIHALGRAGLEVEGWMLDTTVAAFLLDAGRPRYGLDELTEEFLGTTPSPAAAPPDEPATEPVERAAARVAERARRTRRLAGVLRGKLEESGLEELYDRIDGPLLPLLARMERCGVRLDVERLERMSGEMGQALERVRRKIHELAGGEFNVDSPKQLREVLFDRLGLESRRRTAKSRAASTDARTLEELSDAHPIAGRLLEYRTLAKLKGTYVDALPRLVDPEDGRLHTSFNPTGAATGRLSSSDPNLQNIPTRTDAGRRIREAFVPEDGFVFLASDYSQVELRVLAHLTGDPELTAAFRSGEDIHRRTAARVFEVHPDLVSDEMRRRAKAVNFGVLYGMSELRLAREQRIPRTEARKFIRAYFERFAGVRAYIDEVRDRVQREGEVRTLFGRVRRFPQLRGQANRAVREQALRAAVNTTVQGTAADLMKLAMLAVARELERASSEARILLQVHDELLLEVPEPALEPTAEIIRRAMENVHALNVPLTVDQGTGRDWSEAS
jgi:DNA polymerase-1